MFLLYNPDETATFAFIMKKVALVIFILMNSFSSFSQLTNTKKGEFYSYWGYNWSWYTKSDVQFQGENYDFEIQNMRAKDRETPFSFKDYLSPSRFTIPQYNFRLGYYLKDDLDISIAIDHMKYVMVQNQFATIEGEIQLPNSIHSGIYSGQKKELTEDFLTFEHTDGLNYVHTSLRKQSRLVEGKKTQLDFVKGISAGVLLPKTNTKLLNKDRYDEVHLSGYGAGVVAGLRGQIGKVFFVQTELKSGYIHMANIRTTKSALDQAKQDFFYTQYMALMGAKFNLRKRE